MELSRTATAGFAARPGWGATSSRLRRRQAVILVGAALGMGGGFAALYFSTLSLFLKPIALEFSWGRGQTAAATVLAMAGMAVGAVLMGRLIDRLGAARVVAVSALGMAALTAALSGLPGNPWAMGGLCFAIGLIGAGTTPLGYLAVFPRWFDRRLGLALGTAMVGLGLGLGTVVFPILAQQAIDAYGWRDAYVMLAVVSLLLSVLAWVLMFVCAGSPPEPAEHPRADRSRSSEGLTLGQAVRSLRYWNLVLILFLASAAGLGLAVHGTALLTDRGIHFEAAAQVAALAGLGVMLGRMVSGFLMDVWTAPPVGAVSFLLGALGMALYAHGPLTSPWVLAAAGMLGGFAIGAEGDLIPYAVRRYFGARSFASIYGTLFGVYALGGLLGPIVFGIAFDRTGSYKGVLNVAIVACGLAALGALLLGRERYSQR